MQISVPSFVASVLLAACVGLTSDTAVAQSSATQLPDKVTDSSLSNSRFIMFGSKKLRTNTLKWAARRRQTDMVPALIYALRYLRPNQRPEVVTALQKITRQRIDDDWFKWMQWQQANPQIKPFAQFELFLGSLLGSIDPGFREFIYPGVAHDIRLEEIVWGGVRSKDGIPPLENPKLIPASQATYLTPEELVFGIDINGDVRAYPYRFMDWHEMLNDVIGGVPVSLAYCTLCGSGILYATSVAEQQQPITFGSSGLLYQSNKLMFDRATLSLWNQFTGRPVVGKLTGSGLQLTMLPLVTTTWQRWLAAHPATKVMSQDTGYVRNYQPGQPYGKYFRTPRLMFPTLTDDRQLRQKEQVFGLRLSGANRAWPLKDFKGGKVINDQIGTLSVVLIGDAKARNVRAYRRSSQTFAKQADDLTTIQSAAGLWRVQEHALVGPNGAQLTRLPGHLAFWFAWHNYVGGDTLAR